ncbi:hypothetical protein MCOR02_005030 [Pyricularia oryzae]|uniref:Uncharacterized protein n=1 Tax=Pyricularia oryzae TaxID=318829 RepID=A0A4P7N139_PYROR|nr:hypothetical protein MCOR02_005030 [Pyricularia oryzae]KAI6493267.1 hypothetical protein MCOR13_007833 [Pyricularia oryzae]KAI6621676.1 hypothetical protein MCOR14_009978 [Pyricularia oryzae]QBZ53520.1 hypothetical protein PoMZ_09207 [Pyricularia oryzae]
MTYSIEQISFTQSVIGIIVFVLFVGYTILYGTEEREERDLQAGRPLLREGTMELAHNHQQREQEVPNFRLGEAANEDRRNRIFLRSHIHAVFACVQNCQQPYGCRYTEQRRARDLEVELPHECCSAKISGLVSSQDSDTASTSSGNDWSTTTFASGTVTPGTPVTPVAQMTTTLLEFPGNRYHSSLSFLDDYGVDELE